ncbi:MAG: hypothetical protein V9F82_10160 [Dermatophilaceae bacterium]
MAEEPHTLAGSAWRFVVVGGLNTVVTGLALSALATVVDPRAAYALVYALGVVAATLLAGPVVYRVDLRPPVKLAYAAMYVAVFLAGLFAVDFAGSHGMPASWSGLVVLVTAPLTFLGGRLLTQWAHGRPAKEAQSWR